MSDEESEVKNTASKKLSAAMPPALPNTGKLAQPKISKVQPHSQAGSIYGSENPEQLSSTYSAILNWRRHSIGANNLNGGAKPVHSDHGSFFNRSDQRMDIAHQRSNFEKKINASFSFDPMTMICSNCNPPPLSPGRWYRGAGGKKSLCSLRPELFSCPAMF